MVGAISGHLADRRGGAILITLTVIDGALSRNIAASILSSRGIMTPTKLRRRMGRISRTFSRQSAGAKPPARERRQTLPPLKAT